MAIDIYQKRNELQNQFDEQKKRFDTAGETYQSDLQASKAKGQPGPMFSPVQVAANDLTGEKKAKGKYDAESHAANVEMDKYRKLMQDEDQRINAVKPFAELQEKQEMRAKEFRTAFPSILDSKLGSARTDMRRQIADGVNNTRAGYNQRGLLFSGMRAGAESDVGHEAENKLADTAVQTQQELMDQANGLDQDAVETGMTMGNISKDLASTNEDYRKSVIDMLLQKDQAKQSAIGGLLGTGAQIAGYGLGAAIK